MNLDFFWIFENEIEELDQMILVHVCYFHILNNFAKIVMLKVLIIEFCGVLFYEK